MYGGGYFYGVRASPAVSNGFVYRGTVDGAEYALNGSTGKQIWEENIFRVFVFAAVTNGVVYVGGYNDVYVLNSTTGFKIWDFPTPKSDNCFASCL